MCNTITIEIPNPIGFLVHKETKTRIAVYKSVNWFRKLMFKLCFGLIYEKI